MLIQAKIRNKKDQVHIFQSTYFENFRIHPQAIMYQFEHTNHAKHLCLSNILQTLFEHVYSLYH